MSETTSAHCYGMGGWHLLPGDPLAAIRHSNEDWNTGMARLGWSEFCRIGPAATTGSGTESPLRIVVHHRPVDDNQPRFLIELDGNLAETCEHLYAADPPSLMTLLASWGPALHTTALAHLAAALPADPEQLPNLLTGTTLTLR